MHCVRDEREWTNREHCIWTVFYTFYHQLPTTIYPLNVKSINHFYKLNSPTITLCYVTKCITKLSFVQKLCVCPIEISWTIFDMQLYVPIIIFGFCRIRYKIWYVGSLATYKWLIKQGNSCLYKITGYSHEMLLSLQDILRIAFFLCAKRFLWLLKRYRKSQYKHLAQNMRFQKN